MRRAMASMTALLIAVALVPAHAAVERVVAGPAAGAPGAGDYLTKVVVSRAGTEVIFENLDVALPPHDVLSADIGPDGRPWCAGQLPGRCRLFASEAIFAPETTPVRGTELLEPGLYDFFCSFHTWMTGTLVVV